MAKIKTIPFYGVLRGEDAPAQLPVEPRLWVRNDYNYDKEANSDLEALACDPEEDLTKQEFAEEVDINTLLRRFHVTGELPSGVRAPVYGDFTEVYDFHSAANAIAEANEAFDAMPAEVRRRFKNDPAEFVAFCSNEANRSEAEALGLVVPKPMPEERPPEPIQTPPAPGPIGEG